MAEIFVADGAIRCYVAEMEPEFDSQRISRTIALRRGLYRSRAYSLIAAIACAAGAAQCAYLTWRHVRTAGWGARPIVLIMLMVVAIAGVIWFARRAQALRREAEQTRLDEPTTPPDFSSLSDGSQRAANLEQIRE